MPDFRELERLWMSNLGFKQLESRAWAELRETTEDPPTRDAPASELQRWRSLTKDFILDRPEARWSAYLRKNTPAWVEMFPGIRTNRVAFWQLLDDLATHLPEIAPPSDLTITGPPHYPGVVGDWSSIRSVMDLKPNPAGTPPDKTTYFKQLSIAGATREYPMITDELEAERQRYFEELTLSDDAMMVLDDINSLYFRRLEAERIKIPKFSQYAFPWFTKSPNVRLAVVNDIVANGDLYMKMLAQGDLDSLADHGIYFLYAAGWRIQTEAAILDGGVAQGKKQRIAHDYAGRWESVSRAISDQIDLDGLTGAGDLTGPELKELSERLLTGRARVINQAPPGPTMLIRAVAHAHHAATTSDFPETMYFAGAPHMERMLRDATWVATWDVANHDWAVPWQVIVAAREGYASLTSPTYGYLLELLDRCPSIVPNDYAGMRAIFMRGNPLKLSDYEAEEENHNKSGRPDTSKLALYFSVFYFFVLIWNLSKTMNSILGRRYLSLHQDLGLLDPRALDPANTELRRKEYDRYLTGQKALAVSLTGDNGFAYSKTYLAAFTLVHLRNANPYARIDYTPTYNGLTPAMTTSGWDVLRDITTLAGRLVNHDRSIGDPRRGSLMESVNDREILFGKHPLFEPVYNFIKERIHARLGSTLEELAARDPQRLPPDVTLATKIDRDVYDDPSKAMWKYRDEQISMELLRHHYLFIPIEDAMRMIEHASGRY